jgi:thiol-disulfide isomerase/thioredoxin
MRFVVAVIALSVLATAGVRAASPPPAVYRSNTYTIPAALENLVPVNPPKQMPKTTFQDPSGAPVSFSQFKGRRLLVFFWSQGCVPCLKTMPSLNTMADQYAKGSFEVIPIAVDSHGAAGAKAVLARQKWTHLRAFADPNRDLANDLGITSLPTSLLIDPLGRVTAVVLGAQSWDSPDTAGNILNGTNSPTVKKQ